MKAIPKWNNTERKRGFVGSSSGSWRVKWQVVVVGVKKTGRDIGGIKTFVQRYPSSDYHPILHSTRRLIMTCMH